MPAKHAMPYHTSVFWKFSLATVSLWWIIACGFILLQQHKLNERELFIEALASTLSRTEIMLDEARGADRPPIDIWVRGE